MATEPVSSPILVGRDDHLAVLDERLADAAAGRGRTILLAGEAGIGKTRLLGALIRRARELGFAVAKGDLGPTDEGVPGAVILELARTMRDTPGLEATGQAIVDRWQAALGAGSPTYSRTLVLDVVDALRSVIVGPFLFAFEDLQWADDLSLECIGELARLAGRRPLMVVGAYRRDDTVAEASLRGWRSRLLTQRLAEELRLGRLTIDETATVTTLLLGSGLPAPRDLVAAVYRRSDGLPLHIEELMATARARGPIDARSIDAVDIPDTIEDAILARVASLQPETQRIGRAAAVLGRCFVPDVLAGIVELSAADLEAPLQELVGSGVLYPFGMPDVGFHDFRHQLLREALYRSTPEAERRRYHARAAEFGAVLEGATDVHASLHFARAGMQAEAFATACAGAASAARVYAHREAFALYQRAVANMPDDLPLLERADLLARLSDEASAVEENDLCERMARASADAFRAAGHPARALLVLGNVESMWRRMGRPIEERRALLDDVEAECRTIPGSGELDEVVGWSLHDRLAIEVDAMDLASAALTAARAAAQADVIGDEALALAVASRAAMGATLGGDAAHGLAMMVATADDARARGHTEVGVTAFRNAAVIAARVLDYAEAERSLAEGLAYADSIQQSHCAHVMAAVKAEVDWAAGRWDEAVVTAEQAVVDRGCARAPAMASWPIASVAIGRGQLDRARAVLQPALDFGERSGMIEWRLPPRWGLAEAAVLAADHATAIAEVEAARGLAEAVGERALFVPFIVTGVRAYQQAGRPEDAERWTRAAAAFLAPTPAFGAAALAHAEGLVALASGATAVARRELEAAVAGWDSIGRIWEGSWARLDLATAFLRTNRFAAGVSLAGQVQATAAGLGCPSLHERAEALVRHGRGRVVDAEPWHPLTTREFEVARLVGAGLTNAEIGDALRIAPKTASAHVEHILAKLGASRRAEIATWASHVERAGPAR